VFSPTYRIGQANESYKTRSFYLLISLILSKLLVLHVMTRSRFRVAYTYMEIKSSLICLRYRGVSET